MEESVHGEDQSSPKESPPDKDEKKKKKKSLGFALPDELPTRPDENAVAIAPTTDQKQSKRARFAPQIQSKPESSSKPEWYQELADGQVSMFREVFEMLDRDGGGSIDAEELYSVMKDLDIAITLEEIQTVLKELDTDGNGEIDFDEFLYAMTETDRMLDSLAADAEKETAEATGVPEYTRRQTLFFTAITKFAIKNSLGEIERYYAAKARKVPHVISHYTAGARLDGLNDKQLASAMRRMQMDAKKYDSPYAKPLPFVVLPLKKGKGKGKKSKAQETEVPIPVVEVPDSPEPSPEQDESGGDMSPGYLHPELSDTSLGSLRRPTRRGALRVDSTDMHFVKMLRDMADQGSVIARLPGVHKLPQVRAKLESGEVSDMMGRRGKKQLAGHVSELDADHDGHMVVHSHGSRISLDKSLPKKHGWTCPRVNTVRAPLPVLTFEKGQTSNLTIEDVPLIRRKVSYKLDQYYSSLRKAHVRTAWEHWGRLYTQEISSTRLLENFRKVYRAYSPHKEGEVFVICPWIPGPQHFHQRFRNRVPPQEAGRISAPAAPLTPEIGRRCVTPTSRRSSSCFQYQSPYRRPRSNPA